MARSDWKRPELTPLAEGMRRVALTVSYDGFAFHGWQSQDNGHSVQAELEKALREILSMDVTVQGSGRTDKGVHAVGQVCHVDFPATKPITAEILKLALYSKMMKEVRVLSSEEKDGSFHARFTTMAREYRYFVKAYEDMLPFDRNYITPLRKLPSLEVLNSYAALLKGTHDFTTFAAAKDECPSKYRDIYESYWTESFDMYNRRFLCYVVVGNAFLYHQVRSMVGTMLALALKDGSVEDMREILESRDRQRALKTAPSEGLYLYRISYDEEEYRWFEEAVENG